MMKRLLPVLALAMLVPAVTADDWPQWHGPQRNGISPEKGLLTSWPKQGPPLVWTYRDAGQGYSTPSIVGNVLYCMGARGAEEVLYALDLKASPPQELWKLKIGPTFTFDGNSWNTGPSSAPSVVAGQVYALGGGGEMLCATTSGKVVWRKSLANDLAGEVNPIGGGPEKLGWGYASSPLVDGDHVLVYAGGPQGSLAALDIKTGNVAWRSKGLTEQATYSSPVLAEFGGVKQVIVQLQDGAAGVARTDGSLLWRYKRDKEYGDIVAPTPIVKGDLVFITAAPRGGRDLLKITGSGGSFKATKVYGDEDVENHHGGVILVGDHVFGTSGETRWNWFGSDFATGKVLWQSTPRTLGRGSLTYADGHLYCFGDRTGLVALVPASAEGFKIGSSFKLPEESKKRPQRGGYWTHPVISHGKLYLRDQELLFCYDVKGK